MSNSTLTLARDIMRREDPFGHFPRDHVLFENFAEIPSTAAGATVNKHFIYEGDGVVQFANLAGGGLTMTTRAATADNDTARVVPASTSTWVKTTTPAELFVFDCVVRTPAAITLMQIYAGMKLTGTNVLATDGDQALFFYDTDNTLNFGTAGVGTVTAGANWKIANSVAGNDVATDTAIPVVAATNYRFTISIDSDLRAHYYINGIPVLVDGSPFLGLALTSTGALLPQIGVSTRDGGPAVRSLGLRCIRLQRPYL